LLQCLHYTSTAEQAFSKARHVGASVNKGSFTAGFTKAKHAPCGVARSAARYDWYLFLFEGETDKDKHGRLYPEVVCVDAHSHGSCFMA